MRTRTLINKSQVRALIKSLNINEVEPDFYQALNDKLREDIMIAIDRCLKNDRKTLMIRDV